MRIISLLMSIGDFSKAQAPRFSVTITQSDELSHRYHGGRSYD